MSPQSNLDSDAVPYIFFLFIGLIGAVGSFAYWNQTGAHMLETADWKRVTCEIIHSEVRSTGLSDTPWEFDVRYQYSFKGATYHGSRFRLGTRREGAAFEHRGEVEALVRQYREGHRAACFVDPANPSASVLQRRPILHAFTVVIPGAILLFSAIGLILTGRWLPDPIRRKRLPKVIVGTFAVIAVGVGVAMGSITVLGPVLAWYEARDWRQVTAVIERSDVDHGGGPISGGGPFWDLRYRYEVDGKTYYGNDYGPLARGTYSGLDALSARYPAGSETTAWVDPSDPDRAFLTRRVPFKRLWPAWILLLILGVLAAVVGERIIRKKADRRAS